MLKFKDIEKEHAAQLAAADANARAAEAARDEASGLLFEAQEARSSRLHSPPVAPHSHLSRPCSCKTASITQDRSGN